MSFKIRKSKWEKLRITGPTVEVRKEVRKRIPQGWRIASWDRLPKVRGKLNQPRAGVTMERRLDP